MNNARGAAAELLESSFELRRLVYIDINNRLEGSAPLTVVAVLQLITIFGELSRQQTMKS